MKTKLDSLLKVGFAKESKIAGPLRNLVKQAGYTFSNDTARDCTYVRGPGRQRLWFEFARGWELCRLMQNGIIDVALIGQDVIAEYQSSTRDRGFELVKTFDKLAPCRLVVAAPQALEDRFAAGWWPQGLRYGTSYPALTDDYLASMGADRSNVIIPMSGGIEASVRRREADIIVDIAATGKTLAANDLVEVETLLPISAALVAYRPDQLSSDKSYALSELGLTLKNKSMSVKI